MNAAKKKFIEFLNREVYGDKKLSFWERFRRKHKNPSTNAVYLIRAMQYYSARGGLYKRLARRANLTLVRRYNIYVGAKTEIGIGLKLPHPTGIIIGQTVKIGENCKVFQHVTIGSRHNGDWKLGKQPHIGNNCSLFAGCAVIGEIEIGDGVQIGANAVMNKSADSGSVWAGVPAREITSKGNGK